jgi:trehalose/maltose hydrolase-like predicted phosphorylase
MADDLEPTADPGWVIQEQGFDPLRERGIESRFSVGNGFLGVRGVPPIRCDQAWASRPRTFVAGLFDTPNILPAVPALVSGPDWVGVTILVDGEPLLHGPLDVADHTRTLDMEQGALFTAWRAARTDSAVVRVRSRRLVSQADRGVGLQRLQLDFGGTAEIELLTSCACADPALETVAHWRDGGVWRVCRSGMSLAMSVTSALTIDGRALAAEPNDDLTWRWRWTSAKGQTAVFERLAAFARGDDPGGDPGPIALAALTRTARIGWRAAVDRHEDAWAERRLCSDVKVEGDPAAQATLRFAAYHLNSAANPIDERVSIGARALTGDDYRGHVFWDTEIFLLPFFTLTWPEAARAMLMYRYHALGGARAKAARMGWRGAFYAWESASTGDDVTPTEVIGADGSVIPILSGSEEEHVSADVAYAVWTYWRITGDDDFLLRAGAEILFETARFWASRARMEADGLRHIRDVEGPDEYHEHIDDSAFTNVMARWNLLRGAEVAAMIWKRWPARWKDLAARLGLADTELEEWSEVADTLATGFDPATGLFEQFSGFFKLDEVDLAAYANRTTPMDVVLGRERISRSQVIKQADVVALLALAPEPFDPRIRTLNFRYYEPRCDQSSSLSPATHALVAARLGDRETALRYFRMAAAIDLDDPGARSAGGVHIATMGGLWQAAVFGFGGLSFAEDAISIDPVLPAGWSSLTFAFQWRGSRLRIRVEPHTLSATLERGEAVELTVLGRLHALQPGAPLRIDLDPAADIGLAHS